MMYVVERSYGQMNQSVVAREREQLTGKRDQSFHIAITYCYNVFQK